MARLSALLLDLYRYAHELPIGEFQERALRRLQQVLSFDSGWWGMSRMLPGRDPELHSSFPFNLPAAYADAWEAIKQGDELAKAVHRAPGITVHFDAERMRDTGVGRLARQFGFTQAMSTLIVNHELNLITFLSLYRNAPEPSFSEQERLFKQSVMPHFVATWNMNWISGLEQLSAHSAPTRTATAIADRRGVLLSAEPRFLELLRLDWPDWKGPGLPPPLAAMLETRAPCIGAATIAGSALVADLYLVEIRARSAIDRLSQRERAVAVRFAEGHSYKEIAESLGLAPATVRHHLRRVYSKLSVSDKAALSRLLIDAGTGSARAEGTHRSGRARSGAGA